MNTLLPNPLPKSNQYFELRAAALEWLRDRFPSVWTDFNSHDPGITTLETALYALTELLHKTNLDIEKLIGEGGSFFSPEKLLFSSPVTLSDYRRYLMESPDVQMAWVERLNCPKQRIFLAPNQLNLLSLVGLPMEEIQIKGLYNSVVELAPTSPDLLPEANQDLNDNVIRVLENPIVVGPDTFTFALDYHFPYWDELLEKWRNPAGVTQFTLNPTDPIESSAQTNVFFAQLALDASPDRLGIYIYAIPEPGQNPPDLTVQLKTIIESQLSAIGADSIVDIFVRKALLIAEKMKNITNHLLSARNLCEDFAQPRLIRIQEIVLRMDLQLLPGYQPEALVALLFHQIDGLINPTLEVQTLTSLKNSNIPPELYMQGPEPRTSGILYPNLDDLGPKCELVASDLIHMVLDIPGISTVEYLRLGSKIDGVTFEDNLEDKIALLNSNLYRPRFSRTKSNIRLLLGGVPIAYNLKTLAEEEIKLTKPKSQPEPSPLVSDVLDFPIRVDGTFRSIQKDFPPLYGLNRGELSENTTHKRFAQAKQFQAYLLFFDQLLANGNAQVSSIGEFFSTTPTLARTIFVQAPDDMDNFDKLVSPNFNNALQLLEDDNLFLNRRNQVLNHLLARFGHSDLDYTALPFLGPGPTLPVIIDRPDVKGVDLTIIKQKSIFLEKFPELSAQKFQAFTYQNLDEPLPLDVIWDTYNVSGLEKRLAVLLDLSSIKRRNPALTEDTLYLLEHILLSPMANETDDSLLLRADISDQQGNVIGSDRDPYSFRVTIFMPGYFERFKTPEAKRTIEQRIALEMPAHLMWDVFWAKDLNGMMDFVDVLKPWLILKASPVPVTEPSKQNHLNALRQAQHDLVLSLNQIRQVKYPYDAVGDFYDLKSPPFIF